MTVPAYAELAVTSNFSFLRGASHPEEFVHQAPELGLCRHRASRTAIPWPAWCAPMAPGKTRPAPPRLLIGAGYLLRRHAGHPRLSQDRAAYGRLCRLLTLGKLRAEKGECLLDLDDLWTHRGQDASIVMPLGRRSQRLELAAALKAAGTPASGSPPSCSIAATTGAVWRGLRRSPRAARVPLVAINDVLYHAPERRPLQDVVTCIREHVTLADAGRRLDANAERHLKPAA